jgi:hypothetical protein
VIEAGIPLDARMPVKPPGLLSQIGGDRTARSRSLELLLTPRDISPGSWTLRSQRAWVAGTVGNAPDVATQAGKWGSYVAWRWLRRSRSLDSLWLQVCPLLSAHDSATAVPAFIDELKRNAPLLNGELTEINDLNVDFPFLENAMTFETATRYRRRTGTTKYSVGTVGRAVAVILSRVVDSQPVPLDFVQVVSLQAQKLSRFEWLQNDMSMENGL